MERAPVLFDLDGTLVDTIELLVSSMRFAFAEHDGPRPTDREWITGIGTPLVTQFRAWARDDAEVEGFVARYRVWQAAHHDRLTHAYPGARETLVALRDRGHPIAVVTSKISAGAHRTLAQGGLRDLVDVIVGADDTARHKPDPEPVLVALARVDRPADRAVFVGDSPHDIRAGNAAGVATGAALWGPFPRSELTDAAPSHFVARIEDVCSLVETLDPR